MTNISKLLDAVNKTKAVAQEKDPNADRYWKAEMDKTGNGFAIIRFLPGKTDDDIPFVKTMNHGFQGDNGRWYIENCPTTIGQPCPVCEGNGPLWNSGVDSDKDIVRKRKRKVSYVSNILVVSDSKNPENEGKVFLFRYGQKIFDKIVGALKPEFEDETPMNPFDPDSGANFKLKIRKVEGYANFDRSEFEAPSAINVDAYLGDIVDLASFIAPDQFKPYADLKARFDTVVGGGLADIAKPERRAETPRFEKKSDVEALAKVATAVSSDDDDMDYFRRLAEDD